MNQTLENFARQNIREGLAQLPIGWQDKFKLMYGRNNGKRSVEDAKALTIEQVVAEVKPEQLDWAMQQVENSIKKWSAK